MFYCIIIDSISPHLVHETLKMTRSMVKTHVLYKKGCKFQYLSHSVYRKPQFWSNLLKPMP